MNRRWLEPGRRAALVAIGGAAVLAGVSGCMPRDARLEALSRAVVAACASSQDERACYEPHLLEILEDQGLPAALEVLRQVAESETTVERDAHVYAHALGINAYTPGEPFADVFAQCTELFQSGCYHGVIQAYFVDKGADDAETVRQLCTAYDSAEERWLYFQCLHGLGHALTMLYGHALQRALEGCDVLETAWDRESCYGGAFMENVVSVTHPEHPAASVTVEGVAEEGHDHGPAPGGDEEAWEALRAEDPHYPCSVLDDRYLRACYMMQTSAILWHNGWDIPDAAQECGRAPEAWRATCFQSLGRDLSSLTLQDPAESLRLCMDVSEDFREWCYVGLVKNFVDLTATTESAFAFCSLVEDFAKPRCYEAVGEQIWNLEPTDEGRRAACAPAEDPQLRRDCLRGARVLG